MSASADACLYSAGVLYYTGPDLTCRAALGSARYATQQTRAGTPVLGVAAGALDREGTRLQLPSTGRAD